MYTSASVCEVSYIIYKSLSDRSVSDVSRTFFILNTVGRDKSAGYVKLSDLEMIRKDLEHRCFSVYKFREVGNLSRFELTYRIILSCIVTAFWEQIQALRISLQNILYARYDTHKEQLHKQT